MSARRDDREDRGEGGSRRVQRVERELREVVASYALTAFRGQLKGLVTISRVQTSKDLRYAKVFVSVLGAKQDAIHSLDVLGKNVSEIQQQVNRSIRMKYCPKITFFLDEGAEKSLRVFSLLKEIESNGAPESHSVGDHE